MIRAQVLLAALLVVAGCDSELIGDGARPGGRTTTAVGASLQALVLERAEGIAPHNRPYVYNGVQDCYGYVRQVINPFLVDESHAFQVRDNVRLESGPDGWHGEWFLLDY